MPVVAVADAAVAGDMAVVEVAVAAAEVATVVAADAAVIAETEAIAAIVGKQAVSGSRAAFFQERLNLP